jgi:hypothetical protein
MRAALSSPVDVAVTANVSPIDPYMTSAFGELRTAAPFTHADLIHKYGLSDQDWDSLTVGGGAISDVLTESSVKLEVGAANNDEAGIRTHTYFRYQAGKGHVVRLTLHHSDAGQANQVREWGYFDGDDGLFFRLSGTTLSIVRRTSTGEAPTEEVIPYASWNGVMGTDPDGPLDLTKGNIFEIRFQWLGVGDVWFYVNGHLAHYLKNKNRLVRPYIATATLPVSVRIENTAASAAGRVVFTCASVISDGGCKPLSLSWGVSSTPVTVAGNAERPLLSIRPLLLFKTIANRAIIVPLLVGIQSETNRCSLRLLLNTALTAPPVPVWNDVSTGKSCVGYNTDATTVVGGQEITKWFVPTAGAGGAGASFDLGHLFGAGSVSRKLRLHSLHSDVDMLTLVAKNEQGGNADLSVNVVWGEVL